MPGYSVALILLWEDLEYQQWDVSQTDSATIPTLPVLHVWMKTGYQGERVDHYRLACEPLGCVLHANRGEDVGRTCLCVEIQGSDWGEYAANQ